MASARVQRQIDALLDKAEEAINAQDWEEVRKASESALRLDPENEDAQAYLVAAERSPVGPARDPSPTVPMPAPLADKVRSERGRVEGERRVVTVLFADARNFTGQSERLDEEAVYEAMRACLRVMADSVYEVEGTVTQFRGDGIMAIFGAPIAHEDAARRGVLAALHMQERLKELASELQTRYGFDPAFRVGLNTGPVVVGTINDRLEMDFTALGDTVNLAARMEAAGEPGAVYVTAGTQRATRGYFECEPLGNIEMKGKSESIPAYKVLRATGARTRLEATIAGGLSAFTGRDQELSVLTSYYELARQRRPQALLVTGEAGIGKSRLLHEFRQRVESGGGRWLQGQCSPLASRVPYFPLAGLIRQALGLSDEAGPEEIASTVEEYCAQLDYDGESPAPYLRFLLSGSSGDARVDRMDPLERRVGLLDAVRSLIDKEQHKQPLVLAVEDLHWIDDGSEAAFESLASTYDERAVLFVATVRPGYEGSLTRRPDVDRVALAQLPSSECHAIAASLLGTTRLPEGFDAWLASRTGGNPLFVEEIVRSLVESNTIRVGAGGAEVSGLLDQLAIPDTVQGVILSRIDRLPPSAKEALQLASVIGREFTARLLDRLAAAGGNELDPATLASLRTLELIREKQVYPELAYMFKHALTHDVAYSTLLHSSRRRLHHLAASAIEQLYADRLRDYAEVLARHYLEAEELDSALPYLLQSADKAISNFAIDAALAAFAEAVEVAARVGDLVSVAEIDIRRGVTFLGVQRNEEAFAAFARASAAENSHVRGMALGQLALAQYMSALFLEAMDTARDALAVASAVEGGDKEVELLARTALTLGLLAAGDTEQAREQGSIAAAIADHVSDPFIRGWAALANWHFPNWEGRFDAALEHMRSWDHVLVSSGNILLSLGRIWLQSLPTIGKGEYQAGLDMLHEVLAISDRVGDILWKARSLNTIGWIYGELCDPLTAERWNRESLDMALATQFADPMIECFARLNLGDNLVELGRTNEGEAQYRAVETMVRTPTVLEGGIRYSQHLFHSLGELELSRGDATAARAHADECLALAERHQHPKNVVKALRLHGDIRAVEGDHEQAVALYLDALKVALPLGNPAQTWKTYVALAKSQQHLGRHSEAADGWANARMIVEATLKGLSDPGLRQRFESSREYREIMAERI